jgi:hypothetical protein
MTPTVNPYHLNQYTREVWSEGDAYILAQLEPAFNSGCYRPKIYKAPDITQEVIQDGDYVQHGMKVQPGSLIIGFNFPSNFQDTEVQVQVLDVALNHKWYSEPIPWYMISNGKTDFPCLLKRAYPVAAPGLFLVEFWNVSGEQFRTQLQFVVMDPK